MCHEWWLRHMLEEREASREACDELEQTRTLSDPEPADEEAEITLEHFEPDPVPVES